MTREPGTAQPRPGRLRGAAGQRGSRITSASFAVTAGHGLERLVEGFEREHDDYSAILAKALADRLAEAFAERLHERVRREFWGYARDEALENDALIKEQYQGIRPAPGYPACPDHTEKATLFDLLGAEDAGRDHAHREFRDDADGRGERLLLLAPGGALFRRRQDREGSGRGLCRRKGLEPRGDRALAGAESGDTTDDGRSGH